jgi:hypothetical protein
MTPLLSEIQCHDPNAYSTEGISWLGLELTHAAAKLTFSWGCLSDRSIFLSLSCFATTLCLGETRWDRRTLAIMHRDTYDYHTEKQLASYPTFSYVLLENAVYM